MRRNINAVRSWVLWLWLSADLKHVLDFKHKHSHGNRWWWLNNLQDQVLKNVYFPLIILHMCCRFSCSKAASWYMSLLIVGTEEFTMPAFCNIFCEICAITSSLFCRFIVAQKCCRTNTYSRKGDGRHCFFSVKRHLFVGEFMEQEQRITRFITLHVRLDN